MRVILPTRLAASQGLCQRRRRPRRNAVHRRNDRLGRAGPCSRATISQVQARQALKNIAEVLREAGGVPENIVRMTWYVTDKREYLAASREVGRAYREIIGAYNAAMTAVEVRALMEDRAKVEIEATAVLPE